MNGDTKRSAEYKFSSRVEQIFTTNRYLTREFLADFKAEDIEVFKRIASGEIPHMIRGNRVKALMVISQLGGVEECKILSRIIANDKEDTDLRAIAAINLSLLPPEDAVRELISNLWNKEDVVLSKVIKSLGRIGGKNALEALDKISDIKSDFVRKELAFAKALISSRLGLDRKDLAFVEGADRKLEGKDHIVKFSITQIKTGELRKCLQSLEGSNYNVELSKNIGFKVECLGRINFVFLLNNKYKNNLLSGIINKKALFGLLARRSESTGTYAVQSVVLISPRDPATVEIMVCRTDGEVLYSGSGHIKDGTMTFSITDIERPGSVQRQITGQVTDKTLEFQKCFSSRKRQNKRRPMELNV